MHHPTFLAIYDPAHRSPELPPEHQDVEGPLPVLLQLVAAGGGEVLLVRANRIFEKVECYSVFKPLKLSFLKVLGVTQNCPSIYLFPPFFKI